MRKIDILVIGAGQAGLALGYHLKKSGYRFLFVDGNECIGDSWRKRYDSLLLFTPRSMSALPGLDLEGDRQGYASRDEFAGYLERYAVYFDLPVQMNTRIERLEAVNGHFLATRSGGHEIEANVVVLANGGFQKPIVPGFSKYMDCAIQQFSAESYKNPSRIQNGTVVVVGDGATGRDIAFELADSHSVYLATGKPRRLLPERVLGASMWWLLKLGLLTAPTDSFIGRKMQQLDSFPNRERDFSNLRSKGIRIMPKLIKGEGDEVCFENGTSVTVNTIIWAMGYHDDSDWVAIPDVKDERGNFIHHRGISPVKNLYFIGRPWQTSRASAIIYGVGGDAQLILNEIKLTFRLEVGRAFVLNNPSL
jgi:putative flavoprotein involved in K+ transport